MTPNEGSRMIDDAELERLNSFRYNASFMTQFVLLLKRIHLTYWRTPNYSVVRHFICLLIALIFGSAYPQQEYSTYIAVLSRSAVIYFTALACGILSMFLVGPVLFPERPAFYREQQSRMYAVWVYVLTLVFIEVRNFLFSPDVTRFIQISTDNIDSLSSPSLFVFHITILLYCWI